jgi:hypothetical protein
MIRIRTATRSAAGDAMSLHRAIAALNPPCLTALVPLNVIQ